MTRDTRHETRNSDLGVNPCHKYDNFILYNLIVISSKLLSSFPNLIHGFSDRPSGNMSLFRGPKKDVIENRTKFLASLGISTNRSIAIEIVQSDKLYIATEADAGKGMTDKNYISNVDGIFTNKPNLFLFATAADCLLLFLFDPEKGVVGLVHAGWRGLTKSIPAKAIRLLINHFRSDPSKILVYIGPSIHPCCYNIGSRRANILKNKRFWEKNIAHREGKIFADLQAVASEELKSADVLAQNIEVSPICTGCHPNFFSKRQDLPAELAGGKDFFTNAGIIGMRQ